LLVHAAGEFIGEAAVVGGKRPHLAEEISQLVLRFLGVPAPFGRVKPN
jgi:hypothetical protein